MTMSLPSTINHAMTTGQHERSSALPSGVPHVYTAVKCDLHQQQQPEDSLTQAIKQPDVSPFPSTHRTLCLGAITGLTIQIISLGAYAALFLESSNDSSSSSSEDESDEHAGWFHFILASLTKVDLCMYLSIWLAFTFTMTRSGMAMVRSTYGDASRRDVFVCGVTFLTGIVGGAFVAWTTMDLYLGFPIPFLPIVFTVFLDLCLCYLMVCCYDCGRKEGNRESLEEENISYCC